MPAEVVCKVAKNLDIPAFQNTNRNNFELTDPPAYGIFLWAMHEDTMIYAVFPDIDPKDPSSRPTKLAIAPNTVSLQRLIQIYKDFTEIKPDGVVEAAIVHLSKEQLAVLALHDYDQDNIFGYLYNNGEQNTELFEIVAIAELLDTEKGDKANVKDEICPK